jgi:hypothetical protein
MKSPRYQLPPRKWLAWISSLLAVAVIVWQVGHHQALSMQSIDWGQLSPNRWSLLAFAALLVPVNWGIEALKWHVLLERKRSSIGQSYREVIVGATWGFLTPNRSGDAVARVALLPAADRARGLRSFGWSAWSQAGMTLTFGALAWIWILNVPLKPSGISANGILGLQSHGGMGALEIVPWIAFAGTIGWWSLGWANNRFGQKMMMRLGKRIRLPHWLHAQSADSAAMTRSHLPLILMLSALRYGVFACQFVLGLMAYGFNGFPEMIGAVALVYWGNMIIPTAALAEMGIREALIVLVIQPQSEMVVPLITGTFAIWMLNLVLPALLGAIIGTPSMNATHEH